MNFRLGWGANTKSCRKRIIVFGRFSTDAACVRNQIPMPSKPYEVKQVLTVVLEASSPDTRESQRLEQN
jgi:hypothetical protein